MCGYFAPYYSAQDEAAPFMACGERGYTAWQPGIKERKAGDPSIPPRTCPNDLPSSQYALPSKGSSKIPKVPSVGTKPLPHGLPGILRSIPQW